MPPLLLQLVFNQVEQRPMFLVRPIAKAIVSRVKQSFIEPQLTQHLDYLEAEMGKNQWFAGNNFTAADIQMSFPLEVAVAQSNLNASRPKLMAFLERIHSRPAYQRALERGGTYELLS